MRKNIVTFCLVILILNAVLMPSAYGVVNFWTTSKPPKNLRAGAVHYTKEELFYDDFTTLNTTLWDTKSSRDTYPMSDGENVILTATVEGMYGQIWLKQMVNSDFEVEFSFYIGNGSCGDGLVFMFFKDKDYDPVDGGELGFSDGWPLTVEYGFGVEIDTYGNEYDPYGSDIQDDAGHIAVIKNVATYHLVSHQISTSTIRHKWHTLKVRLFDDNIKVWLDGNQIIDYSSSTFTSRKYAWMGFSASTGGNTDYHKIGFFRLWRLTFLDEVINTPSYYTYIVITIVVILAGAFIVLRRKHSKLFSFDLRKMKRVKSKVLDEAEFEKILVTYKQKHHKITKDILSEVEHNNRTAFGRWLAEQLINENNYDVAKDILVAIKDYTRAITVMTSLAIMKKFQGKIDEAKAIYLELAELLRKTGDSKKSEEILRYAKTLQ